MEAGSWRPPFTLDSDCIIKLGRRRRLKDIRVENDEMVIIAFKVYQEIRRWRTNKPGGSRAQTWLNNNQHLVKRFVTPEDHQLYYRLIAEHGEHLGEGEAASIAVAIRRRGTLVSDDRAAQRVARSLDLVSISIAKFERIIILRLPLEDG